MLILWLIGSGIMVLFGILICLLPTKRNTSMESLEGNIQLVDKYLKQIRRDRIEKFAANQLGARPFVESDVE
jgi:hypothetical protein